MRLKLNRNFLHKGSEYLEWCFWVLKNTLKKKTHSKKLSTTKINFFEPSNNCPKKWHGFFELSNKPSKSLSPNKKLKIYVAQKCFPQKKLASKNWTRWLPLHSSQFDIPATGALFFLCFPLVQTVQNMHGKGGERVCKAELRPLKVDPYFERKKITLGGVTKN